MDKKRRIGIVGFGHLGKYLTKSVLQHPNLELAFVWNRRRQVLEGEVHPSLICQDLEDFASFRPDLIVEVAHPIISEKYGVAFLNECDYMVGSPTALASQHVEHALRQASSSHGLYIPAGAFWGGEDIAKMADTGSLKSLGVTMKKHPSCFKLESPLKEKNLQVSDSAVTLYDGPVRELCKLAPNNVNTMAAAAMAAHNLGFDGVNGCLISDPSLRDWHIVEIDVTGPPINGNPFTVMTSRKNPASPGAVTGSATYASFFSSVLRARGRGTGVHLC